MRIGYRGEVDVRSSQTPRDREAVVRVTGGRLGVSVAMLLCVVIGSGCGESSKPVEPDTGLGWEHTYPNAQDGPDWSRQGEIVYEDNGLVCVDQIDTSKAGLWVLDPATSITRRVSSFGVTPSWSPDGQHIAFATPWSGSIFTMAIDGSELRQITPAEGNFSPRWSPDGSQLCWAKRIGAGGGVYVADSDGNSPRLVLPGADFPDWNPVAPDTLLCAKWEPEGKGQYLVGVSVTTGGYRTLLRTFRPTERIRYPRYAPDAKSIAFVSLSGGPDPAGIYLLASGAFAPLALLPGHVEDCCWSPGGDKIAYLAWDPLVFAKENGTIWSVDVTDRNVEQLTHWWPSECDTARGSPAFLRAGATHTVPVRSDRLPGSN